MGNVKKIISFILLFFISTALMANMDSFIKDNLGTSLTYENPGYFKTQTRGYFTLGSARIRWDQLGTVHPFNFQPPSIKAGCSGIDLVMGGFSYLNFEYLVQKLKAIASAAPAFAFKMAMSTLCKDCDTIMTELEKIADMINGLNFDTCKMMNNVSGWAGKKLRNVLNTDVSNGTTASWVSALKSGVENTTSTLQGWIDRLEGDGNSHKEEKLEHMMQGSLVTRANSLYTNIFNDSNEWEAIVRYFVGDVVGYINPTTQLPDLDIFNGTGDIDEFIKFLQDGGQIDKAFLISQNPVNGGYSPPVPQYKTINLNADNSIKNQIKSKIQTIATKIQSNQDLDDNDIKFINSLPLPIYRIINVMSIVGNTGLDTVSEYLALEEIDGLIRNMLMEIQRFFTYYKTKKAEYTLTDNDKEKIYKLVEKIGKIRTRLDSIMVKKASDFNKKMELVDYYRRLNKRILEKSPIWLVGSFGG